MERTPEADGGNEATPASRKSKQPLYLRMYQRRHLVELVRLFKHASIPIEQVREQLKPFVETYGKQTMEDAAEEILFIDDSQSPVVVRLTDEARQLAIPLIGRRPESSVHEATSAAAEPIGKTTEQPTDADVSVSPPRDGERPSPTRKHRIRSSRPSPPTASAPTTPTANASNSDSSPQPAKKRAAKKRGGATP